VFALRENFAALGGADMLYDIALFDLLNVCKQVLFLVLEDVVKRAMSVMVQSTKNSLMIC
jgi:hypothetical protein